MSFQFTDDDFRIAFNAQLQQDSQIKITEVQQEDHKVSFTMAIPAVGGGFKEVKVTTEDKRVLGKQATEVEEWVEEQVSKVKAFREQEIASLVTWQDKPHVVQIKMAGDSAEHTFEPGKEVQQLRNEYLHVSEIDALEQKIHKLAGRASQKVEVGQLTQTLVAEKFRHAAAKVAADIFVAANVTLPTIEISPRDKIEAIMSAQIGPTMMVLVKDLKIEELLELIHSPGITNEALEKLRELFDKKPEIRKLIEIRFLLDKNVSINARDGEHLNISHQNLQ